MNSFPLKIAFRYLLSKKSHTAVTFIAVISVCAVAVTSLAMICILSVFNGFSRLVNDKLSQLDPDIRVEAATGKVVADADSIIAAVRGIEGVASVSPTIVENALAIYGDRQVPVTLKGVAADYGKTTDIVKLVKDDGAFRLSTDGEDLAVASVGAAIALQAHPGYFVPVEFYAPKRLGTINPVNAATAFRREQAYISGVFEVGQSEYDATYVIVPIDLTRRLFDYPQEASSIEIRLQPGAGLERVMEEVENKLGPSYKVEDRLMQHSDSLKMINIEKWVTFLLLGFILIIASFNIISTLAILIIEKKQSIATFRAMGADNRTISRIFVAEGWLISLSGAVIGLISGILLCFGQQYFGWIKMDTSSKNLIIDTYPVAVEMGDVLSVLAVVAVVGLLTSFATTLAMRRSLRG